MSPPPVTSVVLVPATGRATDAFLRRSVLAYAQLAALVVAAWRPAYPELVVPSVRAASALADLKDGDAPVMFTRTIDQANDLAYHSEGDGIPYGVVLFGDDQAEDDAGQSGGHEVGELLVDPTVDRYDLDGYAVEPFDPTENTPATLDLGDGAPYLVSAFAFPGWLRLAGRVAVPGEPLDSAGVLSAVHGLAPGGYAGKRDGSELFGRDRTGHPLSKLAPSSRRSRRRRRLGLE